MKAIILSRMQPLRQERISIHIGRLFEFHSALAEKCLQASIVEGIKCFCTAANMMLADKDLWDGRGLDASFQHIADLAAPIVLLVVRRIEIDRPIRNVECLE